MNGAVALTGAVDKAEVGTHCNHVGLCRNSRRNLRTATKHRTVDKAELHVRTIRLRRANVRLYNDYRQLGQHTFEKSCVRGNPGRE